MRVAGRLHRGVERERVRIVLGAARVEHRRQVGAAAEPGLGRDHEARVHVHRRHMRIPRMRDQRDAGGPEARIGVGARNFLAEFRRELADARSRQCTPTFSNTRPCIIDMTPPPPGAPCDRCAARACARSGRAASPKRRAGGRGVLDRLEAPRRYRRAALRTRRAPCALRASRSAASASSAGRAPVIAARSCRAESGVVMGDDGEAGIGAVCRRRGAAGNHHGRARMHQRQQALGGLRRQVDLVQESEATSWSDWPACAASRPTAIHFMWRGSESGPSA